MPARPDAPVRPRLIVRHELVAALDRAADRPVTIISGPAGSGKTSLLRSWADRQAPGRRIAIAAVRPGERDVQFFWLTLLGAIRRAHGAEPPAAAPGFDQSVMAAKILSELGECDDPFTLVIDDLHELGSTRALEQLTELLTSLPPHVHAIVATRHDPGLRLHRLRLAGDLAEIRGPELRFSEDETREFLAASGIALTDHAVAMLYERTEGWAAGLRLAALSLDGHPDPERFVAEFSGSDRSVAEYLIAEMLYRQPDDVRSVLLRTSLLDRVNGELADLLTKASGSERILLELEDANAFVVSLDAERTWFRYHHLFSDLLRLELRRTCPEEIPALHRLAARWFAGHAQAADAVRHLQAAGDWSEAGSMLTDHALSLTLDGQAGIVRALLRSFPRGTGGESRELALVYAIADLDQLRLEEAAAHLRIAQSYAATAPPGRRRRLHMAITSLDLLLARLRGNFEGVFEQVSALSGPLTGQFNADVALASDLRALALLSLGVAEAWSLRRRDSERHLLEGAALARDIGRPYLEVACHATLGFASTVHSSAIARRRCEEAIALAARYGWESEPVITPALATLGGTLIRSGEFADGERWLDRAWHSARAGSEPGIQLMLFMVAGMLRAARGDHHQALEEFESALSVQALMAGEHALTARVTGWLLATQARLGMVSQARALLASLPSQQASKGEIRNGVAVICLAEGDLDAARGELRAVLDGNAPVNHDLALVEAHLLDALACRQLGDQRAATAAAERALGLAEPDRLILPFAMHGSRELLESLSAEHGAHASLIATILNAIPVADPAGEDHAAPGPAEDLSPSELRVLRYLPTNLTRPEIASELSVSLNTVNTHLRKIYAKLDATDRSSAVRRARELLLLPSARSR